MSGYRILEMQRRRHAILSVISTYEIGHEFDIWVLAKEATRTGIPVKPQHVSSYLQNNTAEYGVVKTGRGFYRKTSEAKPEGLKSRPNAAPRRLDDNGKNELDLLIAEHKRKEIFPHELLKEIDCDAQALIDYLSDPKISSRYGIKRMDAKTSQGTLVWFEKT